VIAKKILSVGGSVLGAMALVLGLSTQASAAGHWDPGYIDYQWYRGASAVSPDGGATMNFGLSWGNSPSGHGYSAAFNMRVWDSEADGRGAKAIAGYNYWNGSTWVWTTRNAAIANGGNGDIADNSQIANVPVKDVQFKVCTYDSSGLHSCSGWK
jgi:hypothetical protein